MTETSASTATGELTESWTVFHQTPENEQADLKAACPEEVFPPGWYVLGGEYLADGPDVSIRIEHAYDSEGGDADERIAHLIADALLKATGTNYRKGDEQE